MLVKKYSPHTVADTLLGDDCLLSFEGLSVDEGLPLLIDEVERIAESTKGETVYTFSQSTPRAIFVYASLPEPSDPSSMARTVDLYCANADRPDGDIVEIEAVAIAGLQRFNEEAALGDLEDQGIAGGV